MTTNDEKLWEEIENCLEYDNDYYDESVFLHATSIENLMNWFKNKETDLLKEEVEQIRKETAREILNDLRGLLEGYVHTKENISLYERYCHKYDVEVEE